MNKTDNVRKMEKVEDVLANDIKEAKSEEEELYNNGYLKVVCYSVLKYTDDRLKKAANVDTELYYVNGYNRLNSIDDTKIDFGEGFNADADIRRIKEQDYENYGIERKTGYYWYRHSLFINSERTKDLVSRRYYVSLINVLTNEEILTMEYDGYKPYIFKEGLYGCMILWDPETDKDDKVKRPRVKYIYDYTINKCEYYRRDKYGRGMYGRGTDYWEVLYPLGVTNDELNEIENTASILASKKYKDISPTNDEMMNAYWQLRKQYIKALVAIATKQDKPVINNEEANQKVKKLPSVTIGYRDRSVLKKLD